MLGNGEYLGRSGLTSTGLGIHTFPNSGSFGTFVDKLLLHEVQLLISST